MILDNIKKMTKIENQGQNQKILYNNLSSVRVAPYIILCNIKNRIIYNKIIKVDIIKF